MKKRVVDGQINLFDFSEKHEDDFKVGDKVQVNYKGQKIGKIISIYNDGQTINVSWGKVFTAFYYKAVRRVELCNTDV